MKDDDFDMVADAFVVFVTVLIAGGIALLLASMILHP